MDSEHDGSYGDLVEIIALLTLSEHVLRHLYKEAGRTSELPFFLIFVRRSEENTKTSKDPMIGEHLKSLYSELLTNNPGIELEIIEKFRECSICNKKVGCSLIGQFLTPVKQVRNRVGEGIFKNDKVIDNYLKGFE
jgi:hypothetical protein